MSNPRFSARIVYCPPRERVYTKEFFDSVDIGIRPSQKVIDSLIGKVHKDKGGWCWEVRVDGDPFADEVLPARFKFQAIWYVAKYLFIATREWKKEQANEPTN